MNKVKYSHSMSLEEAFRYAHHKMLEVDREDLEELLQAVFNEGLEEGWEENEVSARMNDPEVRFNPLP